MKLILRFSLLFISIYLKITGGFSSPCLLISNNGPSVLGGYISFTAVLSEYDTGRTLSYIFDDGVQVKEYPTKDHNITIIRAFNDSKYEEGYYYMNVTVIVTFIFEKTVVANSSKFNLQRDLIGEISILNSDGSIANDVDEVAIGKNVTFSLNLYDPEKYLNDAIISYGWSVDWERYQTADNLLTHNFSDVGYKTIKAVVTASLPNNLYLSGFFEKVVHAKVPVNHLNVSGNFFMHHGETLNLNINCNGTPPFIYCYKIMSGNSTSENFTCSHVSTFTTCHMEIIKYLQKDGKYNVGIYVSNNVEEIKRVYELMVYSVSVEPTLSTVIIPIVCSLLALVIIASGIAYCVQHKNQRQIEVANFDFQDESDVCPERTFFENILDSFTCRNCTRPRLSCTTDSENDPLI